MARNGFSILNMKAKIFFALSLFLLLYNGAYAGAHTKANEKKDWKASLSAVQLDSITNHLLQVMTLKQKVNEMHGKGAVGFGLSMIFKGHGKVVEAGGIKKLHIPALKFTDGPRGGVCAKSTCFPVTMARGASWDTELEKRVGDVMGQESRAVGGNYSGAVCMNVLRNPLWGRSQETYGEDPWLLGEMASSLVEGFHKNNVTACIKHFAANSMENNRYVVNVKMDERTLREVYLPHFKKCIDRGALSVMSSYNQVNGTYSGHNRYLLTTILRQEWGFKGYVTSDWDNGIYDGALALNAGMNVEMSKGKCYAFPRIRELLSSKKITTGQIDSLVYPTIRTKLLFANKTDNMEYPRSLVASPEHIALAREVAEKSAVLLKNQNNLLPLNKSSIKKIAVIGTLANLKNTGDHGSSWVRTKYIVSPIEGIRNYFKGTDVQILTAPYFDLIRIEQICKEADAVIIVAGNDYNDEGEFISTIPQKIRDLFKPEKNIAFKLGILGHAGDRTTLNLKPADIQVIKTAASVTDKIVVSLVAGGPIMVEGWYDNVPAILQTFYNGMEGGNAFARLVFGDVNPSGKLPFTVPVNQSDLPPFNSFDTTANYGYYHGYTLFDKKNLPVRFPFGFGLSYTHFSFSNLRIENVSVKPDSFLKVTVDVENAGNCAGAEVPQLYIGFENSGIDRPVKLLRGFTKLHLQAHEKRTVTFTVKTEDLAYYNTDSKTWKVENMEHQVYVGNSSAPGSLSKATFTTSGF